MKKFYVDKTAEKECRGYFMKDCELIWAGSTVASASVSERERHREEYERFAREYDVHFLFDDDAVQMEFYTVPWTEVFARDSLGGFLAILNGDAQSEGTVCLISADRKCFFVAENIRAFVEKTDGWQENLKLMKRVKVFESMEDAEKEFSFLKITEMEKD